MFHWPTIPGWGWGSFIVGGLGMLIFWGIIIVVVYFAIRSLTGANQRKDNREPSKTTEKTHLDILKERYVRGEINREEYLDMRKDLES